MQGDAKGDEEGGEGWSLRRRKNISGLISYQNQNKTYNSLK